MQKLFEKVFIYFEFVLDILYPMPLYLRKRIKQVEADSVKSKQYVGRILLGQIFFKKCRRCVFVTGSRPE